MKNKNLIISFLLLLVPILPVFLIVFFPNSLKSLGAVFGPVFGIFSTLCLIVSVIFSGKSFWQEKAYVGSIILILIALAYLGKYLLFGSTIVGHW